MIRSFEKRAEQKISGFQSPAADYLEGRLDLAEKLVIDPHSTFYFQMQGDAMLAYGISDADLLVVDRSLSPHHGAIIIAFISGSFSCRLFLKENGSCLLANDSGTVSETEIGTLQVWGVVTSVCRNVLPKSLRRGRYSNVCTL
ncbi:S24 family peptidase [Pedobacter miscanthi]|uniref:S24 family peptidase n=1 Tax=Pedobacter miscanthi TaxID=2259170 RepID=UPI00292EE52B|nr:S24 family peptidase [Pedobacter miscanthi]